MLMVACISKVPFLAFPVHIPERGKAMGWVGIWDGIWDGIVVRITGKGVDVVGFEAGRHPVSKKARIRPAETTVKHWLH